MNTREIAAEYRLSHWAKIMQDRNASGLSVKAFCTAAGFHENVYYYWQRKLREAAFQELALQTVAVEKSLAPSGWAVCETVEPSAPGGALIVAIGGYRIQVDADTDLELLAKVCRALNASC